MSGKQVSLRPYLYPMDFPSGIAAIVATTSSLARQGLAQTTASAKSESLMNIFSDLPWLQPAYLLR
jgi:hypothetical protein